MHEVLLTLRSFLKDEAAASKPRKDDSNLQKIFAGWGQKKVVSSFLGLRRAEGEARSTTRGACSERDRSDLRRNGLVFVLEMSASLVK